MLDQAIRRIGAAVGLCFPPDVLASVRCNAGRSTHGHFELQQVPPDVLALLRNKTGVARALYDHFRESESEGVHDIVDHRHGVLPALAAGHAHSARGAEPDFTTCPKADLRRRPARFTTNFTCAY
jgi:hypothetical protein